MIVKNPQLTYEVANDISNKMLELYSKECEKFNAEGDPTEHIYLSVHILTSLTYKFILAMDGYAKIYNIEKFNGKRFREWVNKTVVELIRNNKTASDDIYKKFNEGIMQ